MDLKIISPVIKPVVESLIDRLKLQCKYIYTYKENLSNFQKELDKLQPKILDNKKLDEKARRELKDPSAQLLGWLQSVETLEKEWETIKEETVTGNRCLKGLCPDPLFRRRISKQVLELTQEASELSQNGSFQLVEHDPPPPAVVPVGPSNAGENTILRKDVMDKVMDALGDENIRSIGVFGMGGIGKSTLLKKINNELLVKQLFKKVIIVDVNKDPNMENIQDTIAVRLGLEKQKFKDLDSGTRALKLCEGLKQAGSTLILLDNMWQMMDLSQIGLRDGIQDTTCKIILTSRDAEVCEQMVVQKVVHMPFLTEAESWILFEEKAGPICKSPALEPIARDIVGRCKGQPLAISTLALTLKTKPKESSWMHVLSVLKNPSAKHFPDIMSEVVSVLRLSYDNLSKSSNSSVKLCFLYCSLFPQGHCIKLTDLRNYGIAEGFIEKTEKLEEASDELSWYVDTLKNCGLLLDGGDGAVKMHDVVREVAISIASDEHGFAVNIDGRETDMLKSYKRMSVIETDNNALLDPLGCPQLKTLMIAGSEIEPMERYNYFEETTRLLVLCISGSDRWTVPESVSWLKTLRTLYLSECDIFGKLSVLGGLTELCALSMRNSRIGPITQEFGNLSNLKFLDLSYSKISHVEPNVFSRLLSIEELYTWGSDLSDGAFLVEACSLPHISILEVQCRGSEVIYPDCLKSLKRFRVSIGVIPLSFRLDKFQELQCTNLLHIEQQDPRKHHLVKNLLVNSTGSLKLRLDLCRGFTSVTDLYAAGASNCLVVLEVDHCNKMENVINVILPTKSLPFPERSLENLEVVDVKGCHGVLHVFNIVEESAVVDRLEIESLPVIPQTTGLLCGITSISLYDLSDLKSIWNGVMPLGSLQNLRKLEVNKCNDLIYLFSSKIAGSLQNLETLDVITCGAMKMIIKETEESGYLPRSGRNTVIPVLPPLSIFPRLDALVIDYCPRLKNLFSFGVARHLQKLNLLSIYNCNDLCQIIGDGQEESEAVNHSDLLPELQFLHLKNLVHLTSFYQGNLPIACPLKNMDVKACPGLKRLPLQNVSCYISDCGWCQRLKLFKWEHKNVHVDDDIYLKLANVWSTDSSSQLEGTIQFHKSLSNEGLYGKGYEMIHTDGISHFVDFLTNEGLPQLQFESAWVLTYVTCRFPLYNIPIIELGGVPTLVNLLDSPSDDVRKQAFRVLVNVARDFPEYRKKVHQTPFKQMKPSLPYLEHLIPSDDEEACAEACTILAFLSNGEADGQVDGVHEVIKSRLLLRLVALFQHSSLTVVSQALFAVKSIIAECDVNIIDQILPSILNLLTQDHERKFKDDVCSVLLKIMAEDGRHIQAVIEPHIFSQLVDLLDPQAWVLSHEPAEVIMETTRGTPEQIKQLVNQGCIPALQSHLNDWRIAEYCLEGLDNILKSGEIGLLDVGDLHAQLISTSHSSARIKVARAKILHTCSLMIDTARPSKAAQNGFSIDANITEFVKDHGAEKDMVYENINFSDKGSRLQIRSLRSWADHEIVEEKT